MKIKNYFALLFLFILSSALAQTRQITGTVVDDNGMPLPGANIIIQGTSTGTLTDFDGRFAIDAGPEDVLVISYVGYVTHEVLVGDQQDITVNLASDAAALDEVVVVGY